MPEIPYDFRKKAPGREAQQAIAAGGVDPNFNQQAIQIRGQADINRIQGTAAAGQTIVDQMEVNNLADLTSTRAKVANIFARSREAAARVTDPDTVKDIMDRAEQEAANLPTATDDATGQPHIRSTFARSEFSSWLKTAAETERIWRDSRREDLQRDASRKRFDTADNLDIQAARTTETYKAARSNIKNRTNTQYEIGILSQEDATIKLQQRKRQLDAAYSSNLVADAKINVSNGELFGLALENDIKARKQEIQALPELGKDEKAAALQQLDQLLIRDRARQENSATAARLTMAAMQKQEKEELAKIRDKNFTIVKSEVVKAGGRLPFSPDQIMAMELTETDKQTLLSGLESDLREMDRKATTKAEEAAETTEAQQKFYRMSQEIGRIDKMDPGIRAEYTARIMGLPSQFRAPLLEKLEADTSKNPIIKGFSQELNNVLALDDANTYHKKKSNLETNERIRLYHSTLMDFQKYVEENPNSPQKWRNQWDMIIKPMKEDKDLRNYLKTFTIRDPELARRPDPAGAMREVNGKTVHIKEHQQLVKDSEGQYYLYNSITDTVEKIGD